MATVVITGSLASGGPVTSGVFRGGLSVRVGVARKLFPSVNVTVYQSSLLVMTTTLKVIKAVALGSVEVRAGMLVCFQNRGSVFDSDEFDSERGSDLVGTRGGMLVCIDSGGSVDVVGTGGGMLVCIDTRVSVFSSVKAETASEGAVVVMTGSDLVGTSGGMLVCIDSGGSFSDLVKDEVDSEEGVVGIERGVEASKEA